MTRMTRSDFINALSTSGNSFVQGLGAFLRDADGSGKIVCWGGAAEWVARHFETRADREALWNILFHIRDPRALFLFMYLFQNVQDAKELVFRDAAELPPVLRFASSALGEVKPEAARELLNGQAKKLMALTYVMPDRVAPQRESTRRE